MGLRGRALKGGGPGGRGLGTSLLGETPVRCGMETLPGGRGGLRPPVACGSSAPAPRSRREVWAPQQRARPTGARQAGRKPQARAPGAGTRRAAAGGRGEGCAESGRGLTGSDCCLAPQNYTQRHKETSGGERERARRWEEQGAAPGSTAGAPRTPVPGPQGGPVLPPSPFRSRVGECASGSGQGQAGA